MICKKCGTENKDTAKFCKNCGNELAKEERMETAKAVEAVKPHEMEGKKRRQCPFCGTEVSEAAMFCKNCGKKLDEVKNVPDIDNEGTVFLHNPENHVENNRARDARVKNDGAEGGSASNGSVGGSSNAGSVYHSVQIDSNYHNMTEEQLPAKYKPIGAWAYFGWSLLFSIPVAGLIIALVFAVGNTENINLRNFARSMFCYFAVVAILIFLILLIAGGAGCAAGILM